MEEFHFCWYHHVFQIYCIEVLVCLCLSNKEDQPARDHPEYKLFRLGNLPQMLNELYQKCFKICVLKQWWVTLSCLIYPTYAKKSLPNFMWNCGWSVKLTVSLRFQILESWIKSRSEAYLNTWCVGLQKIILISILYILLTFAPLSIFQNLETLGLWNDTEW